MEVGVVFESGFSGRVDHVDDVDRAGRFVDEVEDPMRHDELGTNRPTLPHALN